MALSVVKKKHSKAKRRPLEPWQIRSAYMQAYRERRLKRDSDEFKRLVIRWRQEIVHSPDIPHAEKRRLSQLSDSEFAMYLADQHQQQKLKTPTRRDPHDNKPWLPGYDSV
jgi:hypothetical protein